MKKSGKDREPNLRTWGFAAGAALLLALLTVVLCAMGGVFSFSPRGEEAEPTEPMATPSYTAPAAATPTPLMHTPPLPPTPTENPDEHTVSAIAGKGGAVSPSGMVHVDDGESVTFTIAPESGYVLSELKIDGQTVETSESYTFENVTEDHSLYAVFRLAEETPPPTPTPTPPPSSPTDIIG